MSPVSGSRRLPQPRSTKVSSGTLIKRNLSTLTPASTIACAWSGARGKPSRRQPFSLMSDSSRRFFTRSTMSSLGTSLPVSMYSLASRPRGVPFFTFSRRMSPVEMCTKPYFSLMFSHWVPLPAAGGPAITTMEPGFAASPPRAWRRDFGCWGAFAALRAARAPRAPRDNTAEKVLLGTELEDPAAAPVDVLAAPELWARPGATPVRSSWGTTKRV
mmetsp:Transcript_71139/g.154627  ORF Transcript_71139/g.154627 Transcript_71139/m.154627 type:complete len:216 (-) Transcript_71139:135-782(-)